MDQEKKEAIVRYNTQVIYWVLCHFGKSSDRAFIISPSVRERIERNGKFDNTKIANFVKQTGIQEACFTGDKKFEIYTSEDLSEGESIKHNGKPSPVAIDKRIEEYCANHILEDENLERLIHYISNGYSIKGYERFKPISLEKICTYLSLFENKKLLEEDTKVLGKFVRLAEEKLVVARAAQLIKNDSRV